MGRIIPHSPKKRKAAYHAHEYGTPQKNQVFSRMDAGQSLAEISRETLIHRNTLTKWRKERQRHGLSSERRKGKDRPGKARILSLKEVQTALR